MFISCETNTVEVSKTAGEWFRPGDNQGKPYEIGSDEHVDIVLEVVRGYAEKNPEALELVNQNNKEQMEKLVVDAVQKGSSDEGSANLIAKVVSSASAEVTNKMISEVSNNNSGANSNMMFKIDGSEKVRIDSSGNVGIGTTNTSPRLYVVSNSNQNGMILDCVGTPSNYHFDVRNDNFLEKNRITGTEKIKDFYGSKYTPGDSRPQTFASSADISAYRIKGVWYFDKLHSELKYRLLGIQPYGRNLKEAGMEQGYFWIWYPSVREILAEHQVFNDKNNNNRISFDDLLVNRRFSSFIYKYDNVYGDREITDYIVKRPGESNQQHQLRIILESERIKKEILDFELDMWGY